MPCLDLLVLVLVLSEHLFVHNHPIREVEAVVVLGEVQSLCARRQIHHGLLLPLDSLET